MQNKLQGVRLKNSAMKIDLAKINRIIARDLGDDFDVDDALEQDNGWRGRSEQIKRLFQ